MWARRLIFFAAIPHNPQELGRDGVRPLFRHVVASGPEFPECGFAARRPSRGTTKSKYAEAPLDCPVDDSTQSSTNHILAATMDEFGSAAGSTSPQSAGYRDVETQ